MWTKEPTFKVLPHSDGWEVATEAQGVGFPIIPVGFKTDFASIPRAARWLIPVNGKHRLAALVHDYRYQKAAIPRLGADLMFLAMMKEAGVGYVKRYAMYYAVRAFGWLHYGGGS